jgi:hypothetical protein
LLECLLKTRTRPIRSRVPEEVLIGDLNLETEEVLIGGPKLDTGGKLGKGTRPKMPRHTAKGQR